MTRVAADASEPASQLLGADDPAPAIVRGAAAGGSPFLLVCDHAGRLTPRALGDMGVPAEAWERHIAWDIGAADLALRLAERLGAPAVLQRYSRLVIDCNRAPERPDATPAVSDGTPVPANRDLAPEARARRVAEIHAPYHAAIAAELDGAAARGEPALPVFVHSFTPRLAGMREDRPWSFGVLHEGGSPLSLAMLDLLRREGGFAVGDNEPYAMSEVDYSAPRHALARGSDYLELEVRQDLIDRREGVAWACDLLARLLPRAIAAVARPSAGEVA